MTRIVQFVGGSFGAAVLVAVILDRQVATHAAAVTGHKLRPGRGTADSPRSA